MENRATDLSIERFGKMMELFCTSMDDYLYAYDLQEDSYQISPSAAERFLLPAAHFTEVADNLRKVIYPEDFPMLEKELEAVKEGRRQTHNMHYRWLGKDGEPIWINCRGRILFDENGKAHFLVGCINEIGKRQKADNVSGLLGQSSLETQYNAFGGQLPEGFVLRIGIDDFRDINENFGVEYGDYILKKTAECIAENILPGQKLYRIVADEFAVVDFMGGTTADANALYEKIRDSLVKFIRENHYRVVYTVSAGIFLLEAGRSFSETMTLSEFALSEAKRSGKNSCRVFSRENYESYKEKRELNSVLYHAVKNDFEGFEAYFQPLVRATDGKLMGAETLLRYRNPDGKMLSPAVVIPVLEESGLIIPVGRWIFCQALDACREWQKYLPEFKVNVNLSYVQVLKSNVLSEIKSMVAEYGVAAGSVCIELTESGYLEANPHFTSVWKGLQEFGVFLALDDFGTGYSNLHCLGDLKPAYVKIDRSFMVKAMNREYEYQLLGNIVEMAHSLGLNVCTEGIETEEELVKVQHTDTDIIQGYLFGKPCSREEFFQKFFASAQEAVVG